MKKILTIVFSLLLLSAMVLTVSAAAYMGLSVSSSTLSPGQEFTVYVKLSNSEPVGRGGIVLNYDSSVFQFVGGSCGVSGATLAEVSAGRNGGVFALAENRVVSGTIFTITMRVREGAPQGSYTISGTASMDIACSAGSVTVKVVCQHQYTFTSVDDAYHRRTCSLCNTEQIVSHRYEETTVLQEATCSATGRSESRCSECDHKKQQTIPTNQNHQYTGWEKKDDTSHTGKCTLCNKDTTVSHTWNDGTVITPATCTATGTTELKCTGCGAVKQVETAVLPHNFSGFKAVDENSHRQTCAMCSLEETVEHNFGASYRHNTNEHFRLCDLCGYQSEGQPHTPGEAATADTPQLCIHCSRVLKPAGNHIHSYQSQWTVDAQTHYYSCDGCDEQSGLQLHKYDDDCDTTCDICGHIRTAPHDFDHHLTGDQAGHFYVCALCGEKTDVLPHTPGAAATLTEAQTCADCGYKISPRLIHTHEFPEDHTHLCACGEAAPAEENCPYCQKEATFPWWILCILEAAAIAFLLLKKKRK